MDYDIKIIGEDEDNGLIEFDRLNQLTKSTKDIAAKTLMLRLRGFSDIKPDKNLKKALSIRLKGIAGNRQDGTVPSDIGGNDGSGNENEKRRAKIHTRRMQEYQPTLLSDLLLLLLLLLPHPVYSFLLSPSPS